MIDLQHTEQKQRVEQNELFAPSKRRDINTDGAVRITGKLVGRSCGMLLLLKKHSRFSGWWKKHMKEDSTAHLMDPQNLWVRRSSVTTSPQTTNVDYIEVFVVYFVTR